MNYKIRICQNDNCPHELKPNQKKYCSRKCYQESRALKKIDEAVRRVEKFKTLNPEIVDAIPLTRAQVEQHPKKIQDYKDIPVKYYLIVAV